MARYWSILIFSFFLISCTKGVPEFFSLNPTSESNPTNDPVITPPQPTDVEPLQSNAANWNDYFVSPKNLVNYRYTQNAQACDPSILDSNDSCYHGGPLKRVVTDFSNCDDLVMYDNLEAMEWRCLTEGEESATAAVIYSLGLKRNKSLRDLVTISGWKENFLTVENTSSAEKYITKSKAWWSNPVTTLAIDASSQVRLSNKGSIYVLNTAAISTSAGYLIEADKIAIVGSSDNPIQFNSILANCDPTFATTNAIKKCFLVASQKNFLWIELSHKSVSMDYGLVLNQIEFSHINNNQISDYLLRGIELLRVNNSYFNNISVENTLGTSGYGFMVTSSSQNRFYNITVANSSINGFEIKSSSTNNILHNLKSYNNGDKGLMVNSSSVNNIMSRLLLTNNGLHGMKIQSSPNNTFSHSTIANNNGPGIIFSMSGSSKINLIQTVTSMNKNHGINFGSTTDNFNAQIVAANNGDPGGFNGSGIFMSGSDSNSNIFSENLIVGNNAVKDCEILSTNQNGLQNETCTISGADNSSDYPTLSNTNALLHKHRDLTTSFIGRIITQDNINQSNADGFSLYSNISDWTHFTNPFRTWGLDFDAWNVLAYKNCVWGNNCRIIDWSLKLNDLNLRSKSHDGINKQFFINNSICPSAVHGDRVHSDYLINAIEIIGDYNGNDDGLCQSNEACTFSPHFGYYQGEVLIDDSSCIFQDGSVKGVVMRSLSNP